MVCRLKPDFPLHGRPLQTLTVDSEVCSNHKKNLRFQYRDQEIKAEFDRIFRSEDDQAEIFSYFAPVVNKVFDGENCSIIAYGNTGSGKTHTMYGENWPDLISALVKTNGWQNEAGSKYDYYPGLILRTADLIFKKKESRKEKTNISVKYFQIYNEKIIDLMTV